MTKRIRIETTKAPPSTGFRSQAMIAGGFLFTGGQIGAPLEATQSDAAAGGGLYPHTPASTLAEQVGLCLQHMEAISREAGISKEQVVEVSAFLVPGQSRDAVLAQVTRFLGFPPLLFNARNVKDVAMHALLEMDWIALTADARLSAQQAAEVLRPFGHRDGLVRSGPFIFLNGLAAPGANLYDQTLNLLDLADRQLKEAGTALSNTVKLTVYISEFDIYPQFNDATKQAFASFTPPTRSVLVAPQITQPALLKIDLLALAGSA